MLRAVRALGQPQVLRAAAVAAAGSAMACLPRLAMAPQLRYPTWYLLALLFLGSLVLWAFVFAWHTKYSGRPVFTWRIGPAPFAAATLAGVGGAVLLYLCLDPPLRLRSPQDYPNTYLQWLATLLFSIAFTQLFLVFAPMAWLLRLCRRVQPAMLATVLFGLFVLYVKNRGATTPFPPLLLFGLLLFRIVGGLLAVYFFLRGGVLLVWWWGLLLHGRHLLAIAWRQTEN